MAKKIFAGFLVLGFLLSVTPVQASILSTFKQQLKSLQNEAKALKNSQGASAWTTESNNFTGSSGSGWGTSSSSISGTSNCYVGDTSGCTLNPPKDPIAGTGDTTPRIAYWWGKVNQYVDAQGSWKSDPDGTSGASLDKLSYCKKFYPNTISVSPYKFENIYSWKREAIYEQSSYTATVTTDKCVQGSTITEPSVTVLSPNGGQTFTAGQKITVTWQTKNYTDPFVVVHLQLPNSNPGFTYMLGTFPAGSGQAEVTLPTPELWLKNVSQATPFPMPTGLHYKIWLDNNGNGGPLPSNNNFGDFSDNLFTISTSSPFPEGCNSAQGYSSTTGQSCDTSKKYVNLIYPTSGATFKTGETFDVKWNSNITGAGNFEASVYMKNTFGGYTFVKTVTTADSNIHTIKVPSNAPAGEYKINYGHKVSGLFTSYGTAIFYVVSDTTVTDCPYYGNQTFAAVDPITLLSHSSGQTFTAVQTVDIRWKDCSIDKVRNLSMSLKKDGVVLARREVVNDGQETITIPRYLPSGTYEVLAQEFMVGKTNQLYRGYFTIVGDSSPIPGSCNATMFTRTLRLGSRGDEVDSLQAILNDKGYLNDANVDGYFGSRTRLALRAFQRDYGVQVTGYTGSTTRAILNNLWREMCISEGGNDTWEDQTADAATKANLANARAQAELYYDSNYSSYNNVCNAGSAAQGVKGIYDMVYKAAEANGNALKANEVAVNGFGTLTNATCNASSSAWAAEVPLRAGGMYCVDSTGKSSNQTSTMGWKTSCN